jgi:hypothetical protein
MGNLLRLAALWIAALAVLSVHRPACAGSPRPGAVIITPKRNARVSREAELYGKLLLPGRPVVLVRKDQPGSPWYVQDPGQPMDGRRFKSRVTFGSADTPHDQRFLVMVVLLRNARDMERFRPRNAIEDIPWDMPRSPQIPVLLDRCEKHSPPASVILKPAPGSKVSRMEELVANVRNGASVVAMVRSSEVNSLWWVQDIIESADGGKVNATVRFGNQNTRPGSRFSVVLLLPSSARDLEQFQVGNYMLQLPERIPKSEEVQVVLQ